MIRMLILVSLCLLPESQAEELSPKQLELLKTFRSEFVDIKPGTKPFPKSFQMGNDGIKNQSPKHEVQLSDPFSIAKYEVPQNLWGSVMGSNPSRWKGERNSVELLSFDEAVDFCKKATKLMRSAKLIKDDERIRLPTEAEWEYCARAGTDTKYSFGDDVAKLNDYAWSTHNAAGNDPPVGAKKPNPWGLYDVHGYLWEWCGDEGHANYKHATKDGKWKMQGNDKQRVLRGGSWKDRAEKLTSTYRFLAAKELRDDAVGLRCILSKVKK